MNIASRIVRKGELLLLHDPEKPIPKPRDRVYTMDPAKVKAFRRANFNNNKILVHKIKGSCKNF